MARVGSASALEPRLDFLDTPPFLPPGSLPPNSLGRVSCLLTWCCVRVKEKAYGPLGRGPGRCQERGLEK